MDFYDFFSEIISEEGIWILILIASAFAVASFILLTLRMETTPKQNKKRESRKQNTKEATAGATIAIPVPKTDTAESLETSHTEVSFDTLQENLYQEESKSKKKTARLWGSKKKDEDAVEMLEEQAPAAEILDSTTTPKEIISESQEITHPQTVSMETPGATIDPLDPTSLPDGEQIPVSVNSPTTGVAIDPFEIMPSPGDEQLPVPETETEHSTVIDPSNFTPLPVLGSDQQSSSAGGAISLPMDGAQIDIKAEAQKGNEQEPDSDENQEDWDTTGKSGDDIFDLFDEAEETDSDFAELANSLEDVELEGLITDTEDIVNNLKGQM